MTQIDLNADVGEGYDHDDTLLELVSSANISCGAHAGSERDIRAAINSALRHGLSIGAHPSYPDWQHMGRKSLAISRSALRDSLLQQLTYLAELVQRSGGSVTHIKPHGALYNDAAGDPELADMLCSWVAEFDPSLVLVGLAGGQQQAAAARHGLRSLAEADVDRAYQSDGTLMPRSQPGALFTDITQAVQQAMSIVLHRQVTAGDGQPITVKADTLCIHGDTDNALELASTLREQLAEAGIVISPGAQQTRF